MDRARAQRIIRALEGFASTGSEMWKRWKVRWRVAIAYESANGASSSALISPLLSLFWMSTTAARLT